MRTVLLHLGVCDEDGFQYRGHPVRLLDHAARRDEHGVREVDPIVHATISVIKDMGCGVAGVWVRDVHASGDAANDPTGNHGLALGLRERQRCRERAGSTLRPPRTIEVVLLLNVLGDVVEHGGEDDRRVVRVGAENLDVLNMIRHVQGVAKRNRGRTVNLRAVEHGLQLRSDTALCGAELGKRNIGEGVGVLH